MPRPRRQTPRVRPGPAPRRPVNRDRRPPGRRLRVPRARRRHRAPQPIRRIQQRRAVLRAPEPVVRRLHRALRIQPLVAHLQPRRRARARGPGRAQQIPPRHPRPGRRPHRRQMRVGQRIAAPRIRALHAHPVAVRRLGRRRAAHRPRPHGRHRARRHRVHRRADRTAPREPRVALLAPRRVRRPRAGRIELLRDRPCLARRERLRQTARHDLPPVLPACAAPRSARTARRPQSGPRRPPTPYPTRLDRVNPA